MPRLFIAVDTPRALADAWLRTLPAHRDIRATPAAQLHLTLRFLGEHDDAMAGRLALALHEVAAPPMTLQPHGVGRFRGRQGAILWAGLAESPALQALVGRIGAVLQAQGVAPEARRFWPHLTLARCRRGVPEPLLRDWLAAWRTLSLPAWQVDQFTLFESELRRDGARHTARAVYPLAAPPVALP